MCVCVVCVVCVCVFAFPKFGTCFFLRSVMWHGVVKRNMCFFFSGGVGDIAYPCISHLGMANGITILGGSVANEIPLKG